MRHRSIPVGAGVWLLALAGAYQPSARVSAAPAAVHPPNGVDLFTLSSNCLACHNGLTSPAGADVSIGTAWRATMMANSARDPYWQASVRRETVDHPSVTAEIEDECSICHMPMSYTAAHASGRTGKVFAHLPTSAEATVGKPASAEAPTSAKAPASAKATAGKSVRKPLRTPDDPESRLAQDGVSCALCHQITPRNLGTPASFTGGYVIDTTTPREQRPVYGPFVPDKGLLRIMHSVTGYQQTVGLHIRQSELCATCHTLYTTARGPNGEAIAHFPEQVPFQEWQHSRYAPDQSCQSCHMPAVSPPAPIASVLGQPREGARRHTFVGGNFLMLRMLNRFRADLGVEALSEELDGAADGTLAHLRDAAAHLTIARAALENGRLVVDLAVENLSGHKLPTAYPSRRAWIHLIVRDASGRETFSSGALAASGAIAGNANDENPAAFEPHYRQITRPDQVQIYESILADQAGTVTTGLLKAVRYAKDNRLLPHGFDKRTAIADIAVHGDAADDADFTGGSDRIQYAIDVSGSQGPLTVFAELLFQPIGFRWADNLRPYQTAETNRFVSYYGQMSSATAATLASATQLVIR
jgi:hypothetical protein